MEKKLCDIEFYYRGSKDAKAIRCEITEKIMKNAFNFLIDEVGTLRLFNEEGPETLLRISKYGDGFSCFMIDNDYDDEWYLEHKSFSLKKLKEIISDKNKYIELKWFCNPYKDSPFSRFDPEMEFLYEKLMERDEVTSYFKEKKVNDLIFNCIIFRDADTIEEIIYCLAEEVPSIAFELIELLSHDESAVAKGFECLAYRLHDWLLGKQMISSLKGDLDFSTSSKSLVIREIDSFLSYRFTEFSKRWCLSTLISFSKDLLSRCFVDEIKMQFALNNLDFSQYSETQNFSITIPIVPKNAVAEKFGAMIITVTPLKGSLLERSLKVAKPHEVFRYLMDAIHKKEYTQSGRLAESYLSISRVIWISENYEVDLLPRD